MLSTYLPWGYAVLLLELKLNGRSTFKLLFNTELLNHFNLISNYHITLTSSFC